jgi:hypothetical protein
MLSNKRKEKVTLLDDWDYLLVHGVTIGGRTYEMTGAQVFRHSRLVRDGVGLEFDWDKERNKK